MLLYRPVGLTELALIYDLDLEAFPPRLPEQPIFYPVLNLEYARQIARDWNTKSSPFAGYITKFEVDDDYVCKFEEKIVGGSTHKELWVQAEELHTFNSHIQGKIIVEAAYFGDGFQGFIPDKYGLKNKTADEQFIALSNTIDYSSFDFFCEISVNRKTVFINFRYWVQKDFSDDGLDEARKGVVLDGVRSAWRMANIETPLL